jgi:hypothetical protein
MSDVPRQPPPKKEVALALLEESSMFIHLDPRRPDVSVPRGFLSQAQLVLQVGLNMAIPIPDLKVDDFGISCTLSFNRSPFWCQLPWTAIYALVGEDGRGGVWADDVPPEIQLQGPKQKQPAAKRQRPRLAAVGGNEAPSSSRGDEPAPTPTAAAEEPKRIARLGPRAVPALTEPEEPTPPQADEAESPSPSARAPNAPNAPNAAGGGKKTKREIPPYLRVIK